MNNIKIDNNLLYIGDVLITFNNKIMQYKTDSDKIFILLFITPKKEFSYDDYHNIYCYNYMGKKIWQIGPRSKGDDTVYTMINLIDSVLYANDFLGRRFVVNKENGTIGNMNITK